MKVVAGAKMAKLYDVACEACGRVHEEMFYDPPQDGVMLPCAGSCGESPHRRVFSIQSSYTWRSPESPTKAGQPTCRIGED